MKMADEFAGYEFGERKRQKERRERIATAALNGILANPNWQKDQQGEAKRAASAALFYADALMADIDKGPPK